MLTEDQIKKLVDETVKKVVLEQQLVQPTVAPTVAPQIAPSKPKSTRVVFEKDTDSSFEVIFSERGFAINGTRLSFEALENAISKSYDIVLDSGNGVHLTQVRMQKILKYKDLY